jgi:signal-transduction protein with cAMP-binding, CBS, and nucleotidyltransferase domain
MFPFCSPILRDAPDPVTADVRTGLAEAVEIMLAGGFRHLPVTDCGRVIGIPSMREIPTEYRRMRNAPRAEQAQPA